MPRTPFDRALRSRPTFLGICANGARQCLRICTVIAVFVLAGVAILGLRLSQGPLELPQIAGLLEAAVNAEVEDSEISVANAEISLGRGGAPSGLSFLDVEVRAPDGTLLLSAPRLAARFHLLDLVQGHVQPTLLRVIGARARFRRAADGRIRFGLGDGRGVTMGGAGADPAEAGQGLAGAAGMDAVAEIVESLVGDGPEIPTLARLERIAIEDAELDYEDALSGRRWRTLGSDLDILRTEDGASAIMRAAISDRGARPVRLRLSATRKRGTGRTDVTLALGALRPEAIAEQVAPLDFLRVIDAQLSGRIDFSVLPQGRFGPIEGRLRLRSGRIAGIPEAAFDSAALAFSAEPERGEARITEFEARGPAFELALAGRVGLTGDPLDPSAVALAIDARRLRLDLPERLANPWRFDEGQVIGRVSLDPLRIELAHAHLTEGDFTLAASGQATERGGEWVSDIRTTARGLTVAGLKTYWPRDLAANARDWIEENIVSGQIPELVAQLRAGPGAPQVNVDFRFEELASRYLGEMSPIEGAVGTGHLTLNEFHLALDGGEVAPAGQAPIALDGSRLMIHDLWGRVTPADIELTGQGPVASVLALLDEPPLGLVSKLGVDLGEVQGTAEVTADLAFPLIKALEIEEVEIDARATATGLGLEIGVAGRRLPVTSPGVRMTATAEQLTLEGPTEIDGVAADLAWTERYGAVAGRALRLSGDVTPELLAAHGLSLAAFSSGRAPAVLEITDAEEGTGLAAEIDLGPAALDIGALRWSKAEGAASTLNVAATIGESTEIDRVALAAPGLTLDARGSLAGGEIEQIEVTRFVLDDRAELSGTLRRAGDGALAIALRGPRLDLSEYLTEPADSETGERGAFRLEVDVDRLVLTPKIAVEPARALLLQTGGGEMKLELSGRVGGAAPFDGRYVRRSGEPGSIAITAPDTGALLEAAGFFVGATGGTLALDAELKPDAATDIRGEALIENVTVRRAATFGSILEEGGVSDAAAAVQDDGLAFNSIEIPFSYTDGVLTLGSTIARSPMLAIKVEGEVDEAANTVDLAGVISPAYAVTGALDAVPVLGALLSGGRGEGILAMTFRVAGGLDAPRFSVNPLSVLAPGFLRRVFSGRNSPPSQEFLDQLGAPD